MNQYYDVVVVGGGMVGAASALAMVKLGLRVALIEANPPVDRPPLDSVPQQRVSAIQRSSEDLLRQLGVWETLQACQPTLFYEMKVSDAEGFDLTLSAQSVFQPNLGYLVENDALAWAIWQVLKQEKNCHCYASALEKAPIRLGNSWQISLVQGETIQAKLLIAADGAKSLVRESLGIEQSIRDYEQSCIVGTVATEVVHQSTCWQHYQQQAPFALLPLRQAHHCSIAWYVSREEADYWLSQSAEDQAEAMTQASGCLLGKLKPLNQLQAFPLIRRQSQEYVRQGLVLVGDAAHTVHPQAGQGVNLGFLDVMALSEVLAEAIKHQHPIEDLRVLKRYERRRKSDAFLVQTAMEGLNWLFSAHGIAPQIRKGIQPLTAFPLARALITLPALLGRRLGSS